MVSQAARVGAMTMTRPRECRAARKAGGIDREVMIAAVPCGKVAAGTASGKLPIADCRVERGGGTGEGHGCPLRGPSAIGNRQSAICHLRLTGTQRIATNSGSSSRPREETHAPDRADVLQGTLDLLILQLLATGPDHGWGLTLKLEEHSDGVLLVNQGSLYPALERLTRGGAIRNEWRVTENNRRARYYLLTARRPQAARRGARRVAPRLGRRQCHPLPRWRRPMSLFTDLSHRLRAIFSRTRVERESTEEMQFHVEMAAARHQQRGLPPGEARRRALAEFGGVSQAQEAVRDQRGHPALRGPEAGHPPRDPATRSGARPSPSWRC